jgi:poly-beta-hydroxyalkanoate depolymerase
MAVFTAFVRENQKLFCTFVSMNRERIILAYKNYFKDFISSLSDAERNESFMEKLKQIRRIAAIF